MACNVNGVLRAYSPCEYSSLVVLSWLCHDTHATFGYSLCSLRRTYKIRQSIRKAEAESVTRLVNALGCNEGRANVPKRQLIVYCLTYA